MSNNDPSLKMISIKVPSFMQESLEDIVKTACQTPTFNSAEAFERDEREVYQLTNDLGDNIVQHRLQAVCDQETLRQSGREFAKALPGRVKNQGLKDIRIQTLHGGIINVKTPYFSRNCDTKKPNRACYPVLLLLGIYGYRPRVSNN